MSADEDRRGSHGPMRELREYARGALDTDHHDVSPIAGLVECEETLDVLMFLEDAYEPIEDMPHRFWDTELGERARRKLATQVASEAVHAGDHAVASYLVGEPSYSYDVSGMDGIDDLEDWLIHDDPVKVFYLASIMGSGKTSFAIRCMQVIERHYRRTKKLLEERGLESAAEEVPKPEFATNFYVDTPDRVDHVEVSCYSELVEWFEKGSVDDHRWFFFDEASTHMTAQHGGNAQVVAKKMGTLVKRARKAGVNMGTIGHDKGDVHLLFRAMADFVEKSSLKKAIVYEGVSNREGFSPKLRLTGIPDATWGFDTEDMASWEWDDVPEDVDDELEAEIAQVLEKEAGKWRRLVAVEVYNNIEEVTQTDIAELFDVAQTTVSNWINQADDGLDRDDLPTPLESSSRSAISAD